MLNINEEHFSKAPLNRGLNPRAREEKKIWVKPCKHCAPSIRAQKSARRYSTTNSTLVKAGGVSGKFSIRYITHTQSIHERNTGLQASLSLIEPIQAANTAELIFFRFTDEPRLGKESTFSAQTPAVDPQSHSSPGAEPPSCPQPPVQHRAQPGTTQHDAASVSYTLSPNINSSWKHSKSWRILNPRDQLPATSLSASSL